MKNIFKWLLVAAITLSFSSPALAYWKEKIVKNQIKAIEYIQKLQNGADPDRIERPTLRRDRKARAQSPNRELKAAMARAERYARAGKHDRIEIPEFKYRLVSERHYKKLKKDVKRNR